MSQRSYCTQCAYPQTVCVCASVRIQPCDYRLIVIQHPNEVKQAKNTLRLLQLSIEDITVVVGESEADFASLVNDRSIVPEHTAVIYPSNDSLPLESNLALWNEKKINTLIFIDSTWKKAYKMWKLNPWLQQFSGWHFVSPPASRYQIRKASVSHSLSTLEAVAYCLEQTQQQDCYPLYQLFDAMQQGQLKHR